MTYYPKLRAALMAGISVVAFGTAAAAEELKVGLLTGGSATQNGWNRVAYDALQRIGSELGATISNVELDHNPASYEKAFLDYADQGYDIIIGHGFEFQDAAMNVGPDYPNSLFLVTSSHAFEGNVVGVELTPYQPFYAMGVIAGRLTDRAGYVGGMEIPPIKKGFEAFQDGGKSVNPNFEVSNVFIGNFSDSGAAKEAAISMMSNGAKIIVANADSAALGAFQAVSEAGPDVGAFGAFGDFTSAAPENILGNYQPDLGAGIVEIAKQVSDGTFKADKAITFTFANPEVMRLFYNDGAAHPVSAELRAEVEEVKKKLISGEIPTK